MHKAKYLIFTSVRFVTKLFAAIIYIYNTALHTASLAEVMITVCILLRQYS